jgi:cellulose synthase/poly-beta-1,6-N-acetylglucosamine synthase-like glycosyltransferase
MEVEERGHLIKVYIDDKILIEDAAATIDLLNAGWRVYHDHGRLSYSATPADFGALIIQRRRWANGGLLILPKLLRYVFRWPWSIAKFREALVRLPSLTSASIGGIGLPILLFYRFDDSLVPVWMPIAAIPYYLLLGCDLVLADYRWRDLLRVYALNLLLIPVNLAGTVQSLRQAFTGRALPFKRTPKIAGRTSAPFIYIAAAYSACFYTLCNAVLDAADGSYRHMLFESLNGLAVLYGIIGLIGVKAAIEDVGASLLSRPLRLGIATRLRGLAYPRVWGSWLVARR